MNTKLRNAMILIVMVSFMGFSASQVKADTLYVDVEITIKEIYFHHFANDGDYVGEGEIGFKVTAIAGENYFDYYGNLGKGLHTISRDNYFFFERYPLNPEPYFIIEIWDKDGGDYEKDLVFRARLEIGNSYGEATYDYNGLYSSASYYAPGEVWLYSWNYDTPGGQHTTYPLIDYYMVIDIAEVEWYRTTDYIPKTTIDVDLTYYYSGIG